MMISLQSYRSGIIFFLAVICGIIVPQCARAGMFLILPALMIIITISLLRFPRDFFRHPGSLLYASIQGNIMNYLVLGNFIILTGAFLVNKQELWVGMVLVAAMPLSLEAITLGNSLHLDKRHIFTALAGTHLGTLCIVPLVGIVFFQYTHLRYWNIIVLVLCLIVLPLLMSRVAVEKEWDKVIVKYDEMAMDFSYFLVYYAITANVRPYLANGSNDVISIASIALISTFLFDIVIRKIGLYFKAPDDKINAFILPGTMKACGLAGGIALTVFSPEVAIPSLIFAVFTIIYMNWLKFRFRHLTVKTLINHKI